MNRIVPAFLLALFALSLAASPAEAASSKAKLITDTSSSANTVPFLNAGAAEDGTAATALGVQVGGTEMMRVTASGNVGIGTASPTRLLTVNGIIQTGVDGQNGALYFGGPTEYVGANYSAHILAFGTNSNERVRIDSSGNVGIGTTSPTAALDVNGSISTGAGQAFKIRYGKGSVTINSTVTLGGISSSSVSFGYTFAAAPAVVVTGNTSGTWLDCLIPNAISISSTGFTLYLTTACNNTVTGTYNYSWIAIGG